MTRFDYVVSLDLQGRRAVVLGGGALAVDRVEGFLQSRADVTVIAADPVPALVDLADRVTLHRRRYRVGDLEDAFIAVATLEDDIDIDAAWAEAEERGVLFAALDDIPHCHFAAPARVVRGDLSITISTAGRAPALSKRLRQRLEREIGPAHGELVDVLHAAREQALPRTVEFDVWAGRWGAALRDLDALVELVRDGRHDDVRRRVLAAVRDGVDTPAEVPTEVPA